jgi:predicted metal-dependent hydrolase
MENVVGLDPDELAGLRRGIAEFNAGRFFECHETLEDVWHGIRGPGRDFFQGLIQISVGFYHLGNGNLRGGQSQLEKGLRRLDSYPGRFMGIDLAGLRDQAAGWLNRVRGGEELRCHIRELPKIVFE